MKAFKRFQWTLALLACATWVVPAPAWATDNTASRPAAPRIQDVALGQQGQLTGQLLDAQGQRLAGQPVIAVRAGEEPVITKTDAEGRFQFAGLRGGLYQIAGRDGVAACRCWTAQAAPPSAVNDLLVVSDPSINRGQRPFADLLCGPVLIGLLIAAAIVIPIAVHNSKNDAS